MVYFLQLASACKPIKIGFTTDLLKRIDCYGGYPWPVSLLGVLAGPESLEKRLHATWSHLRMTGEWFRSDPALLDYIDRSTENVSLAELKHGRRMKNRAMWGLDSLHPARIREIRADMAKAMRNTPEYLRSHRDI